MAKDAYLGIVFPIQCRGRNESREEVLLQPIEAKVRIFQPNGNETTISTIVECLHNTGGHGDRCKASHPGIDKIGEGIGCPYSLEIPFTLDQRR